MGRDRRRRRHHCHRHRPRPRLQILASVEFLIRGTEYSWYLTLIVPAFAAYYGGTFVFNNFIKGKEKDEEEEEVGSVGVGG